MRTRAAAALMVIASVTLACSSSSSTPQALPTTSAPATTSAPSVTGSNESASSPPCVSKPPPANIKPGDIFDVCSTQGSSGRFTTDEDATGASNLTINIVAESGGPAFKPAVITGSPGQVLHVTVLQAADASAIFQHNFSIDRLGIDKDIPKGPHHHITVTVTLPKSGSLVFYCKYHFSGEHHAGEFLIAK